MKNFKIKLLNENIPYKEGSNEWQKIVDIQCCINLNKETNLLDLCAYHDMSPKFYRDLSKLINDGLIEVENEK